MSDQYTAQQEALEKSGAPPTHSTGHTRTDKSVQQPRTFEEGEALDGNVHNAMPIDHGIPTRTQRMTPSDTLHHNGFRPSADHTLQANDPHRTPTPAGPPVIDGHKRFGHDSDVHVNAGVCQCYKPASLDPIYVANQALADRLWAGKNQRPRPVMAEFQGYTLAPHNILPDRQGDQYNAPVNCGDTYLRKPWSEHSHNWNIHRGAVTNKYVEFDYQHRMDFKNRVMNNFHDPDILRGI